MADNIDAGYYNANSTFAKVRLRGAPFVGVDPIWWSPIDPPAIDWDVTIELTRNVSTGVTGYKVTGKHDGFPFHDIRLNSTVVWQRDPILETDPHANTPYALLPPSEVTVWAQGSF